MKLFLTLCLSLLAILFSGCAKRGDAQIVHGLTMAGYNEWLHDAFTSLSPEVRSKISETEKEIKLAIMLNHEASGTEGVADAYFKKIDGMKLNDFFALGLNAKIARLETEYKRASDLVEIQSKVKTKPGDYESAEFIRRQLEENKAHAENLKIQITSARADLAALGKK